MFTIRCFWNRHLHSYTQGKCTHAVQEMQQTRQWQRQNHSSKGDWLCSASCHYVESSHWFCTQHESSICPILYSQCGSQCKTAQGHCPKNVLLTSTLFKPAVLDNSGHESRRIAPSDCCWCRGSLCPESQPKTPISSITTCQLGVIQ